MSERRGPYLPRQVEGAYSMIDGLVIPVMPGVLLESHEPPAATGDSLRALFNELIGRILTDHDDFEGIASGRLPASVNQGRDTWRVAREYARRLNRLLGEG